jgi:sialate O-acetylesterase
VWIAVLLLGSLVADLHADVKLADVFSDGMVLQQGMKVNVWGDAAPGEAVTVELAGKTVRTVADDRGQWRVKLPALPASDKPCDLKVTGNLKSVISNQTCTNVLVGEVWLCSGQSNMEWTNKGTLLSNVCAQVCAEADFPQIRVLTVPRTTALEPQRNMTGACWRVCNPTNAANFSATGYFFGRELHRALKVPVGLIVSAVGGTPSESWTSLQAVEKDPAYPVIADEWVKILADYPAATQRYEQVAIPNWKKAVVKAKAEGKPVPNRPGEPKGPKHAWRPGNLFNAMIAPLIPYTIRGVTWYQGESNADKMDRALQYYTLFPTMIKDWRARWDQGNIPFLFVQLANFKSVQTNAVEDSNWPFLREAQTRTLSLPDTGMALAIDVNNEPDNIHPRNKPEVGRRLSLVALAQVYGRKVVCSGPVYDGMKIKADKVILRFKNTDGGLMAQSEDTPQKLKGFAIAGEDRNFVWADAVIDGSKVVVSSPAVPKPVAVRYSWAMNPIGNLYNGAGLPASPFRTDDRSKGNAGQENVAKPNVVYILADDLGWSDLSTHPGGGIPTPNIDRLFKQGVQLNNFMGWCVCSPTRAMLLTGRHPFRVGTGPETGGELGKAETTIAEGFKVNGYRTGIFGKWHNGDDPDTPEYRAAFAEAFKAMPNKRFKGGLGVNEHGFDEAWVYYGGGADYFTRRTVGAKAR